MIQFVGIEKSFGKKQVLKNLSLEIKKGETMTILGGSGSGKTILLKMLLGLMMPDRGRVLFNGEEVTQMGEEDLRRMRRRIGMLFQGGALFDSLSVKENIAYPLKEHFHYNLEEIDRVVAAKLALIGLSGIESTFPEDLSGGMKKRVALARAMATDPELLLYDEPTTGLDPVNTQRINSLMRDLQKKLHVTSIVVTHDIPSALAVSDRLALLYDGRIEFVGSRQEWGVCDNPVVKSFLKGGTEEE